MIKKLRVTSAAAILIMVCFLLVTARDVRADFRYDPAGGTLQYMKDGKADTGYTGFKKYNGSWYYLKNGTTADKLTGITKNTGNGKWYFIRESKVDWTFTGVARSLVTQKWYFVKKGNLDLSFTGVAKSVLNGKWYFVRKGKLDTTFTGVARSAANGKWYFVRKGKLDTGYTGLAKSAANGKWYYVKKGKLDWSYTGAAMYNGKTYYVRKGAVQTGTISGKKNVYLTFDDGPGPYTNRLLSILARYDAKATFFVTDQFPNYRSCIRKEILAGHAVGVHTASHDFAKIYAGDKAFWNDHQEMQSIIKNYTGSRTNLMRFAGGSSNTVSRKYSSGIMSRLVRQARERKMTYFDWNGDSEDAGGARTADQVALNVVNEMKKGHNVILCHDIKSYTVDAMEKVLAWGTKNGYRFLPMTASSPTAHHSVNN